MEKVVVTQAMLSGAGIWSLVFMQVCAEESATDEEILTVCNRENPSGTRGGWSKVIRSDDERPQLNLVRCGDDPKRVHLLVSC